MKCILSLVSIILPPPLFCPRFCLDVVCLLYATLDFKVVFEFQKLLETKNCNKNWIYINFFRFLEPLGQGICGIGTVGNYSFPIIHGHSSMGEGSKGMGKEEKLKKMVGQDLKTWLVTPWATPETRTRNLGPQVIPS